MPSSATGRAIATLPATMRLVVPMGPIPGRGREVKSTA
jgi:hypothetical protein